MPSSPPSSDTKQQPPLHGETVVEVLYSESQQERAVVTRDKQGLYRVTLEYWYSDDWDDCVAQWLPRSGYLTLTDTLERARLLAAERLPHQVSS